LRNCPKFDRRETAQKTARGPANGCNFCLGYFLPAQASPFRRGGALSNASRAPFLRFEETRRLSYQLKFPVKLLGNRTQPRPVAARRS
jgi:hypothetical protein